MHKREFMRRGSSRLVFNNYYEMLSSISLLFVLFFGGILPVCAAENNEGEWTIIAGAGGKIETDYKNSEIEGVPIIVVNYETEHQEYFISVFDGVGFSTEIPLLPLEFELSADFGEQRDLYKKNGASEHAVNNPVDITAGISMELAVGEGFFQTDYYPGDKEYADGRKYFVHPLTCSAGWGFEKELIPVILGFEASAILMDQTYANTYYTAEKTGTFHAQSGLEALKISAKVLLFFSEHIGVGLIGSSYYYPDSVADSPFPASNFMTEAALGVFYVF